MVRAITKVWNCLGHRKYNFRVSRLGATPKLLDGRGLLFGLVCGQLGMEALLFVQSRGTFQ